MEPISRTGYELGGGLQRAWENTIGILPHFLLFLAILVIGYFVAVALGKAADRVLTKLGFDHAVEKSGIKRAMSQSGYHPSDILGKVVFYTIFLFVLQLAFGVFGPNPISDLLTRVIAFLPNIFVAIIITVVAASIAAGVREIVSASLGGLTYGRFLANVAAISIIVVGVFAALSQLGIAPEIVNGLFYALLAAVVGVTIVGIGGGLIAPMRSRWENALTRIDDELPRVKEEVRSASTSPDRGGYMV